MKTSRQSGLNRRPADYKTGCSHGSKWLLESKLRSAAFLDKPRKPPKSRDNCNKLQWKIAPWSLRRMALFSPAIVDGDFLEHVVKALNLRKFKLGVTSASLRSLEKQRAG